MRQLQEPHRNLDASCLSDNIIQHKWVQILTKKNKWVQIHQRFTTIIQHQWVQIQWVIHVIEEDESEQEGKHNICESL